MPVILATKEVERDQEYTGSKPAQANVHKTLSQKKKKKSQKELVEWLKV
jgi:hypothetical protein